MHPILFISFLLLIFVIRSLSPLPKPYQPPKTEGEAPGPEAPASAEKEVKLSRFCAQPETCGAQCKILVKRGPTNYCEKERKPTYYNRAKSYLPSWMGGSSEKEYTVLPWEKVNAKGAKPLNPLQEECYCCCLHKFLYSYSSNRLFKDVMTLGAFEMMGPRATKEKYMIHCKKECKHLKIDSEVKKDVNPLVGVVIKNG